ncbi:MAG: hypothetical protein V7645_914 [Actinomycetota bacterium]|jgi:hypothetical protein
MRRVLQTLLPAVAAALVFAHAGTAQAAGGNYRFDGGSALERTQVREALNASSFNWNLVKAQVTIHIQRGTVSHALPGQIWLDADLLDSGRFSWATVQDEYSHQVDFFLFTPEIRAQLQEALGAKAWCYEDGSIQAHGDQACERFTSVLPWAYWQSADNAYKPTAKTDESAAMAPTKFKALLSRLIGANATR